MDDINDAEEMVEESLEEDLNLEIEEDLPVLDNEQHVNQVDNLAFLNSLKNDYAARKQFLTLLAGKTKEEFTKVRKDKNAGEYKKYTLSHLRQITAGISEYYKLNEAYMKAMDGALMIAKMGPKNEKIINTCNQYLKEEAVNLDKKASVLKKKVLKFDPYVVGEVKRIEKFLNEAVVATRGYTEEERAEYINTCIAQNKTKISR